MNKQKTYLIFSNENYNKKKVIIFFFFKAIIKGKKPNIFEKAKI